VTDTLPDALPVRRSLPRACPGCGAPTQTYQENEAGYYDVERKAVRSYVGRDADKVEESSQEDDIYASALKEASPELLQELGMEQDADEAPENQSTLQIPVCDRCHNLIHHRVGTPIHHPTVEAIQQTIAESPHRRNHIYHVVDAADFPLSIVLNLQSSLRIPKLRTQNRRAKHKGWVANDRIAEVSFIITRADLLAPKKEQVDLLMPYIREVLRDALGRQNQNARLGNVRLVSAKRGWWTKQVKEDIWERGGAGWMVGKVNVGKSHLFEAVFPKGRGADYQDVRRIRNAAEREAMLNNAKSLDELTQVQQQLAEEDAETQRLQNKPQEHLHQPPSEDTLPDEEGEDDDFEDPDALRSSPASWSRVPAVRHAMTLHPGATYIWYLDSTALIMTPTLAPDLVFLIHAFVPLVPHITRTDKAIAYQSQTSDRTLPSILAPNVGASFKRAAIYSLKWDVTRKLAGPLTDPQAGKMRPENLPFRIWSTDILLEGVGWLEVSAQTRRPQGWKPRGNEKIHPEHMRAVRVQQRKEFRARQDAKFASDPFADESADPVDGDAQPEWQDMYPEIEVWSPLGKFVGQRRPMCASLVSGPKQVGARERKDRPRRSMVSVKRQRGKGGVVG
jgi:genetic interactor of prohibitins 3, mitochondrial